MKLIETAPAPNPRRVRIFLAEKDIDIPTEQIDLAALDQKKPEFEELNPMRARARPCVSTTARIWHAGAVRIRGDLSLFRGDAA